MTVPSYESRQPIEFPWTGCIPAHWEYGPYKRQIDIQNGRDHKEVETDDGYPVIGSGGTFTFASDILHNGEAVLLGRKGTIDKPLYINGPFWAVDTMYWGKIHANAHGRFAYYIALTIPFSYYSTNTALPSMTKTDLGRHAVPIPPRDEQIAIAAFLDHETGKIDSLIAEQERLITLLDEKRQAVISHAMTKGLDPDVEMKDSGIEWLGEVPTHWQITRVREAVSLINGYPFDSNKFSQDTGHPLVRIRDLNCKQTALLYDGDFIDAAKVDGNDLLIGMDGDFNVGRWRGQGEALLNQRVCCLRGDAATIRWLEYVIPYPLKLINDVTYSTTVKHLSSGQVLDIRVPLPRGNEMGVLLDHLDKNVGLLDNLSTTAKEGILLLKERRSALISAAVTGKIDVRNHPAAVAALNKNKD